MGRPIRINYARGGQPAARVPLTTRPVLLNVPLAPDKITYNSIGKTQFLNILYFILKNATKVLVLHSSVFFKLVWHGMEKGRLLPYAYAWFTWYYVSKCRVQYSKVSSDCRWKKSITIVDLYIDRLNI